jgi:cytochrome c-type protein NapC
MERGAMNEPTESPVRETAPLWRRWVWLGVPLGGAAAAFVAGIIFWGGFNTAMEATNTEKFCISCHEMRSTVYEEYKGTIHQFNRSGVEAICSDCHVPKDWTYKIIRKVQATKELYGKMVGSISTPEKWEAKRLELAMHEWERMKASDSRECRNCHHFDAMLPEKQKPRARQQHLNAMKVGQTCIDCHKGIAHLDLRDRVDEEVLAELEAPNPAFIREIPKEYLESLAFIEAKEAEEAAVKEAEAKAASEAEKAKIAAAVEAAVKEAEAKAAAAAVPEDGAAMEVTEAAPEAGEAVVTPAAGEAPGSAIDWSAVESKTTTLFYPGQASFEWVQIGKEHGGARPFTKGGEKCSTCHAKETAAMGAKIVSGEKAEATPIPGKPGSLDVAIQSARDAENLYLRLQWKASPHAPVPFVEGGKMDPENPVKVAMMIVGTGIEYGEQAGCWASCHSDNRFMPTAPETISDDLAGRVGGEGFVQKYLPESRTEMELKGKDRPLGGWDRIRSEEEIAAFLEGGTFLDLTRVDAAGVATRGYLLDRRHEEVGSPASGWAALEGDTWTVVIARPLAASGPGQIAIEPGKLYTVGFAIHDDHADARFHHVSLDMRLALDNPEAEINVTQP